MEPVYSVLLFSKYSPNCKKLFSLFETNGLDIPLQLFCIDNKEIRKRIKNNGRIEISTVPCILIVYKDGGVEKYESENAFSWVQTFVNGKLKEQSEIQKKLLDEKIAKERAEQQRMLIQEQEEEKILIEKHKEQKSKKRVTPISELADVDEFAETGNETDEEPDSRIPSKAIIKTKRKETVPIQESKKPKPRIIKDEGNYEENEDFFSSDEVDNRRENRNVMKNSAESQADVHGTLAKAKELAQGREEIENQLNPQNRRPTIPKRN